MSKKEVTISQRLQSIKRKHKLSTMDLKRKLEENNPGQVFEYRKLMMWVNGKNVPYPKNLDTVALVQMIESYEKTAGTPA